MLGVGPCFHLGDPPAPIQRVKESAHVLAMQDRHERLKSLRRLYDDFEAVFEPPASALVDDMLALYPDAKVSSPNCYPLYSQAPMLTSTPEPNS